MLRIGYLRFPSVDPEKFGIEHFYIRQNTVGFYIIGIIEQMLRNAFIQQFFIRKVIDRIDTVTKIRPKFL